MDRLERKNDDVSGLLRAWGSGDNGARDKLIPIVYDELRLRASRQLRKERDNHTLHTTALVHEAYFKLAEQHMASLKSREHFFSLASAMMRRVLVDYARERNAGKRGGEFEIVSMNSELHVAIENSEVNVIELDTALEKLHFFDPQQAKVVELRYFGGCSIEETSDILRVSVTTVKRDWASAKAWLKRELSSPT